MAASIFHIQYFNTKASGFLSGAFCFACYHKQKRRLVDIGCRS